MWVEEIHIVYLPFVHTSGMTLVDPCLCCTIHVSSSFYLLYDISLPISCLLMIPCKLKRAPCLAYNFTIIVSNLPSPSFPNECTIILTYINPFSPFWKQLSLQSKLFYSYVFPQFNSDDDNAMMIVISTSYLVLVISKCFIFIHINSFILIVSP